MAAEEKISLLKMRISSVSGIPTAVTAERILYFLQETSRSPSPPASREDWFCLVNTLSIVLGWWAHGLRKLRSVGDKASPPGKRPAEEALSLGLHPASITYYLSGLAHVT